MKIRSWKNLSSPLIGVESVNFPFSTRIIIDHNSSPYETKARSRREDFPRAGKKYRICGETQNKKLLEAEVSYPSPFTGDSVTIVDEHREFKRMQKSLRSTGNAS